jgi:hypothetical protein
MTPEEFESMTPEKFLKLSSEDKHIFIIKKLHFHVSPQ